MTVEYTISKTRDSFSHATSLAGWQQKYDQLESRAFRGHLVDIRTGSMRLFRERANCKMLQFMRLPHGYRHLLLPLSWPGAVRQDMTLQLLPQKRHYRVVVPGGFDVLCLSIPEHIASKLPMRSREMTYRSAENRKTITALKTLWLRLTDEVSWQSPQLTDATIAERVEVSAMRLLEMIGGEADWQGSGVNQRQYIVERCHDILQAQPAYPPAIDELCDQIRVSRRTLQYSFTSQTGMTPTRYLRNIRLNAIRRAIIAHPENSLLDIAAEHGFLHPSYFGRVYRGLFGERPSDTRRWVTTQQASLH